MKPVDGTRVDFDLDPIPVHHLDRVRAGEHHQDRSGGAEMTGQGIDHHTCSTLGLGIELGGDEDDAWGSPP